MRSDRAEEGIPGQDHVAGHPDQSNEAGESDAEANACYGECAAPGSSPGEDDQEQCAENGEDRDTRFQGHRGGEEHEARGRGGAPSLRVCGLVQQDSNELGARDEDESRPNRIRGEIGSAAAETEYDGGRDTATGRRNRILACPSRSSGLRRRLRSRPAAG